MDNTTIVSEDDQQNLINLVNLLNKTVSQYGLGLIWLFGNIGSILNCIVFSQPAFRKSPCAMYFIASSFWQFFTFNFALFTRMLQYGYNVRAINIFLWYCKFRYYFFYVFVANSRYNLILASVDRYFASSRDALVRQWSSPKIAIRVIICIATVWFVIYSQVLVFYEIVNGSCQYRQGVYGDFFSIYISIDSGILPISLMLIFGLLVVRNVHQTRQRIGTTTAMNEDGSVPGRKVSRKDAQLQKMLANQIFVFVILNIFNPAFLLYEAFTVDTDKSPLLSAVDTFLSNMTYVLVYLGFALTFPNFALTSDMFRREFRQFFETKILGRAPQRSAVDGGTLIRVAQTNT